MSNVTAHVLAVPPLDRCVSVGMGVAATGAGLAISLLMPRSLDVIGAVITTGGLIMIERGITGRAEPHPSGTGSASRAPRGADPWPTRARPSSS